ncbi:MAG: hypothetical protein A4E65_01071 [Syntrophorhabdus sp. PtaU1.Bin153]|nr:MAG: hypothetical protein A4E65_01071 [Syntrophorhabdus sp. PtaU1.Bin153]
MGRPLNHPESASPLSLRSIWLLSLCLLTVSCGGMSCLNGVNNGQESLVIRDVATVILTPESEDRDEVKAVLDEAFATFLQQTGIRFSIKDWRTIYWRGSSRTDVLQQVSDEMKQYGQSYDVAIAIYNMNLFQQIAFNTLGGWMGVVDDVYRRFMVLRRSRNLHVIEHELGHLFLFETTHAGGAMSAFTVCLIGDHLCTRNSVCFNEAERQGIIRNKWRNFSKKLELSERADIIHD